MKILNNKGEYKNYIYKSDIRTFLGCGDEYSLFVFNQVKEYELNNNAIEMFEKRVPQDLFHEFRKKRRR